MSVSSMTNVAVSRRTDDLGTRDSPSTTADISEATGSDQRTENGTTNALQSIATYIPTEVIVLYLAALAAARSGTSIEEGTAELAERAGTLNAPSQPELTLTIVFVILTPLIVWLVYAGKVRTGGKAAPIKPTTWPVWEMSAATLAFLAWVFAIPESPFIRFGWYNLAWATFVVLAVSTALGLLAPVLQRQLKP